MNWEFYFERVTTEDCYWRLRNSGWMWELFPLAPQSWEEHLKALEQYEQGQD